MGLGCYPRYDIHVPGAEYDGDGKGLVRESHNLEAIAEELSLKPLTHLSGADPTSLLNVLDDPDEILENIQENIDYDGDGPFHDASEGLATVRGIAIAIRRNTRFAQMLDDVEYTIEELSELERCLALAEKAGAKFRMELY